jgi:hypothetical protein
VIIEASEDSAVAARVAARFAAAGIATHRVALPDAQASKSFQTAVAESTGMKFTGMPAYLMRGFIHVMYLIGWGNRLGTVYTWGRALYLRNPRLRRMVEFSRGRRLPQGEWSLRRKRLRRRRGTGWVLPALPAWHSA